MTPAYSSGGTGFTRLSKGLSGVLFIVFVVSLFFPWITRYVALVPARTIPFAWNVITAGYLEQSLFGLILSIYGLLVCGKLLEPIWGSREFVKFVFFVNFFTLLGVYVTAVTCYYFTKREKFLYGSFSGFHGVLCGFLVGVKQVMPDQEITMLGKLHFRAEWLPSFLVLATVFISFFTIRVMSYLPFVLFGTYGSWLYLRYLQRNPETNLIGDPDDEFAFPTFFPCFLRPVVEIFASFFHKLLCGNRNSHRKAGYVPVSLSEQGYEATEASRRRDWGGAHEVNERPGGRDDIDGAGEGHESDNV
ncbi:Rhomboid-like protein 19 [Nymphaea thermarum]|nr:Rhomboid-like protein 19 [Nymphaea thermarum]